MREEWGGAGREDLEIRALLNTRFAALPVVAVLMASAASAAGPPSPRSWIVQPTPRIVGGIPSLNGVVAVSATDAWAVGGIIHEGSDRSKALVEHWDGRRWRVVAVPDSGNSNLEDVAASSASDVWAVGTSRSRPLVLHWDGATWRRIRTPPIRASGLTDVRLVDVAVVSPNDVWAVGNDVWEVDGGVVLHWNGHRWRWTAHDELLLAVGAAASDVWAVGVKTAEYAVPFEPILRRWRGGHWSAFPGPRILRDAELIDVAFTGRASGWAVGTDDDTLILRWNGRRWARVSSPRERWSYSAFVGVAALPDGRAWAVGSVCVDAPSHLPEEPWHGDWACPSRPLGARWDGRRWRTTAMPQGLHGRLYGVSAASADAVWAVGVAADDEGYDKEPLILRWTAR